MAISKNNPILKNHFRKDWQQRVKVHFDQAGKKSSRRALRAKKAAAVAPRPTEALRPVVRCPTIRYNRRVRAGRGFSLEELKAAGIPKKFARTIGIAVDHRRQNRSVEGFEVNVERLKEYKARLVLFPRRSGKGGAKPTGEEVQVEVSTAFPVPSNKAAFTTAAVPADEGSAYRKLRLARSYARYEGAREKRAKDKAEAEK